MKLLYGDLRAIGQNLREQPESSSASTRPLYGMSMNFSVAVAMKTTPMSLGEWQTCSGLKVEFEHKVVASGGDYTRPLYFPERVKYPARVVLTRAMSLKGSEQLHTWLSDAKQRWVLGESQTYQGCDVTIALRDDQSNTIVEWVLKEAIPVAWSGPALTVTKHEVALETLELVHRGIEARFPGQAKKAAASKADDTRGSKAQLTYHNESVEFANNPERIVVKLTGKLDSTILSAAQNSAQKNSVSLNMNETASLGRTSISITNMYLVGERTSASVDRLLRWASNADPKDVKELTFAWGSYVKKVTLHSVDITYDQFSPMGEPRRAICGLTLNVTQGSPGKGDRTAPGASGTHSRVG